MGNPQHFGIELPHRCLALIDGLWDQATRVRGGERPDLGPLTTTFLMSMSMPIINLPVERIERQIGLGEAEGYVDDRHANDKAVAAFQDTIQRGRLDQAPFFKDRTWRFFRHEGKPVNFARALPEDIAVRLDEDDALARAAHMPAIQWVSILRNSLAHGGILYLNEDGRSTYDQPVKTLAFVSGKFANGFCPNSEGKECRGIRGDLSAVNILRISESDYLEFLRRWVSWLGDTGISQTQAA